MTSSKKNLRDILDFAAFNNALRNSVPMAPLPQYLPVFPAMPSFEPSFEPSYFGDFDFYGFDSNCW